jgi:uncharacterized protein (DUF433 family)
MVAKSLDRFIEMTPGVMGGVPRIAGHRVRVSDVAIWHERMKWDAEKIVEEIGLTLPEIYAALTFYHDHREEIDQQIAADEAYYRQMKAKQPQ